MESTYDVFGPGGGPAFFPSLFSWRTQKAPRAREVSGKEAVATGKRRILIVEDHQPTRRFLADNLNTHLNHATGTGNPALSVAFPQDLTVSRDGAVPVQFRVQSRSATGLSYTVDLTPRPGRENFQSSSQDK